MNSKKTLLLSFLILALVIPSFQKLSVYNLQALGQDKDSALSNIKYSIANFGFIPQGKTIISELKQSSHFGNQCQIDQDDVTDYSNSIMLIPRGNCTFVRKTLNAQELDARMVVIADKSQHRGEIIMADNGYGYKVNIPAIFIHYNDGELLKKLIDNSQQPVILKVSFQTVKTANIDLSLYLQSNNRHSYKLIREFHPFYQKVKDLLNIKLIYSNVNCQNHKCQTQDCYDGSKYCALNLYHEQSATGKLILDQQIKEQIIYQMANEKWWDFMTFVGEQCAVISELEECSSRGMKKLGIDVDKVKKEFQQQITKYTILQKNSNDLLMTGVNKFPTVELNKKRVKATLNAELIFDDICNTLLEPPTSCNKYLPQQKYTKTDTILSWGVIILVILIGLAVFSLIFWFYKRYIKRKISNDMQERVDDIVSKYVEFYSDRSKK